MRTLVIALTGLSLIAAPVAAKPPLRDVAQIDDGVLQVGIAKLIADNCVAMVDRPVLLR